MREGNKKYMVKKIRISGGRRSGKSIFSSPTEAIKYYLKSENIDFVAEHKGIPGRKFRFDFAIPSMMIAIEYEGGTYSGGAHTRGKHYASDCEKYSLAAIYGWCVIRLTVDLWASGRGIELINLALKEKSKRK
jgi:hypothetical protein